MTNACCARSIAVIGGGAWCQQVDPAIGAHGIFRPNLAGSSQGETASAGHTAYSPASKTCPNCTGCGVHRHQPRMPRLRQLAHLPNDGCRRSGVLCLGLFRGNSRGRHWWRRLAGNRLICCGRRDADPGPELLWLYQCTGRGLACGPISMGPRVDTGVAILTQSSNIAINLTMQKRGLPIAYMVTCGNMAQTSQAEIATGCLIDDPRVTARGSARRRVQAISANGRRWRRRRMKRACRCRAQGWARRNRRRSATVSHTASLAGSDAGAQAAIAAFGYSAPDALPTFLETLKLLHCNGPLPGSRIRFDQLFRRRGKPDCGYGCMAAV